METLCVRDGEARELQFYDFDSLGSALNDLHENYEIEEFASNLPLADEMTPYVGERVETYAGRPGTRGTCPSCGSFGGPVDGWARFSCENCGYRNSSPTRLPRHLRHRLRSLH